MNDDRDAKMETLGGAEFRDKDCASGQPSSPVETDEIAIANVRELLLGDAIRAIREEVLCNHSIVLNRFEALQQATAQRLDVAFDRLDALQRQLDQESGKHCEQLNGMQNQLMEEDSKIRRELKVVIQALDAEARTQRREYDAKLEAQAQELNKTAQRLNRRLERNVAKLGAEGLARTDLAENLTAIAQRIAQTDSVPVTQKANGC